MFRHIDDQTRQTNVPHASVTRQLLGVLGEEEYCIRQEATRLRKLVEERRANLLVDEREREHSATPHEVPEVRYATGGDSFR